MGRAVSLALAGIALLPGCYVFVPGPTTDVVYEGAWLAGGNEFWVVRQRMWWCAYGEQWRICGTWVVNLDTFAVTWDEDKGFPERGRLAEVPLVDCAGNQYRPLPPEAAEFPDPLTGVVYRASLSRPPIALWREGAEASFFTHVPVFGFVRTVWRYLPEGVPDSTPRECVDAPREARPYCEVVSAGGPRLAYYSGQWGEAVETWRVDFARKTAERVAEGARYRVIDSDGTLLEDPDPGPAGGEEELRVRARGAARQVILPRYEGRGPERTVAIYGYPFFAAVWADGVAFVSLEGRVLKTVPEDFAEELSREPELAR